MFIRVQIVNSTFWALIQLSVCRSTCHRLSITTATNYVLHSLIIAFLGFPVFSFERFFEIKKPYDLAPGRKLNRTCSKLEPLENHLIKPEHLFAFSTVRGPIFFPRWQNYYKMPKVNWISQRLTTACVLSNARLQSFSRSGRCATRGQTVIFWSESSYR